MNPLSHPARLQSLDAYRGFVMFLMAAEVLHLPEVAEHFPGSWLWQTLKFHTSHVEWTGCSLHDLIQPSFSFMVGVAMPFSIASRLAKGAPLWSHALIRAFLLVMLGVVLRSMGEPQTNWTLEDTLSQIGLGYPLLFALGLASTRTRWIALGVILIGYWLFFATWSGKGVATPGWPHHFSGFAAHWNLNANAAWSFDTWFLNLFPRTTPFVANDGGYSTLSFIPTLGTMILGLLAGQWIKDGSEKQVCKPHHGAQASCLSRTGETPVPHDLVSPQTSSAVIRKLLLAGFASLLLGYLWHLSGLGPSVKKIWTPSWTLFSGGWCFLFMAAFYWVLDVQKWQRWAVFLIVIGTNSIAMYVLSWISHDFFGSMLTTHFGHAPFLLLGAELEPLLHGAAIFAILWLILFWMYRRRIFIKL
jgi:heparan-alpha-glucosaminide N-acetyltransferase